MSAILHYSATELGLLPYRYVREFRTRQAVLAPVVYGAGVFVATNPNPPLPIPRPTTTGRLNSSYADLFFGYIKYTLKEYTFGVVATDATIDITIWNASIEGQPAINVTSAVLPTDDSLVVVEPVASPYLFPALQEYGYSVKALKEGEPKITDSLFINYDTQPNIEFPISGLRVVVFRYAPDWDTPIEQSYVWSTDVLAAKDGTEQRIQLREFPNMMLDYSLLVAEDEAKGLSNLIVSWGDKLFVLPLWVDCCTTKDISLVGQSIINLNDTTGTAASYSSLFFVPHTGSVYSVDALAVSQSPEAVVLNDTFPRTADLLDSRTYHIPDVTLIKVSISAVINTTSFVTVKTPSGEVIVLLTNVTADPETIYYVRGSTVIITVQTGSILPTSDFVIEVKDDAEAVSITTGSNLEEDIPAGSIIYPCVLAYLRDINEYVSHTDNLKGLSLSFYSEVLSEFPELITPAQYQGYLIEEVSPDWRESKDQDVFTNLVIHDYKSGVIGAALNADYIGSVSRRDDTLFDGRVIKHFKQELQRRAGKLHIYWLPTFTSDVSIAASVGTSDAFLTVVKNNNVLLYNRTLDYKHLRVVMKDGTIHYREIIGAVDNGDTEIINLDSALGVGYAIDDFFIISYMSLVRAESDSVTLVWEHTKLVTVIQSFRSVIQ